LRQRRFALGRRLLLLRQSREKLDNHKEDEVEIDVDDFARYVNDASSRPRY
jgi:hypothetical protein